MSSLRLSCASPSIRFNGEKSYTLIYDDRELHTKQELATMDCSIVMKAPKT